MAHVLCCDGIHVCTCTHCQTYNRLVYTIVMSNFKNINMALNYGKYKQWGILYLCTLHFHCHCLDIGFGPCCWKSFSSNSRLESVYCKLLFYFYGAFYSVINLYTCMLHLAIKHLWIYIICKFYVSVKEKYNLPNILLPKFWAIQI